MKTPQIRKATGFRSFLAGIASAWVAMVLAASCGPASGERGPAPPPSPPPGPAPLLDAPWDMHPISLRYRGANGLGRADVNGDGLVDLVTQVPDEIWWFRKTSSTPVAFERIVIPKDPRATGIGRPIRVGDLTGDGRLNIVGALTHVRSDLPSSAFSVYWMQYHGDAPAADNWTTHGIKWGSGKTMLIPEFGEKWDQMHLVDVDGDGDLDIVANCEEWWANPVGEWIPFFHPRADPESVSVVWFENRLDEMPRRAAEWDGIVAVEAEEPTLRLDDTWVNRGLYDGWLGTGYAQHFNGIPLASEFPFLRDRVPEEGPDALHRLAWDDRAGNTYDVDLAGGSYEVWVRCRVPGEFGYGLGGARSDGAWVGINGRPLGVLRSGVVDAWNWVKLPDPVTLGAGTHTIGLRVQRRAFAVDRIMLSGRPGFVPF
jgi:hypothetical protein